VQGVGFRWWVSRVAQREGLGGSVRNEPDGSVLVVAWGPSDHVAAFERLLHRGPPGARVDAVETLPAPTTPTARGFSIER
jgi:acylphosphatase